jgi:hypothetical protein
MLGFGLDASVKSKEKYVFFLFPIKEKKCPFGEESRICQVLPRFRGNLRTIRSGCLRC